MTNTVHLKGKERKGKGLLYLAVIVAFLSVSAMACKNRGTGTILDGAMPIDLTQDVSQFEGKTFKSVEALDGGNISYLWVKVTENSTIKYQGANTEPDFSKISEALLVKGLGQNYVFTGKSDSGGSQEGSLIFEPDGTLTVKFVSGTSYDRQTVKCKWTDLK